MSQILVATDLTPRAERAVGRAFLIARAWGETTVTVLHVTQDDLPADLAEAYGTEAAKHLDWVCGQAAEAAAVPWRSRLVAGDPASVTRRVAEEIGADLVVTGLHRRRRMFDRLRKTTLELIVEDSRLPILLVADAAAGAYRRVLAAVDFSPASTSALEAARIIAPAAQFRTFHAVQTLFEGAFAEDPDRIMARSALKEAEVAMERWMDEGGLPPGIPRPAIEEGAFAAVLEMERRAFAPDLLAIGAHARHGPVRRTLGRVARDLVRNPPCDLLVARRYDG